MRSAVLAVLAALLMLGAVPAAAATSTSDVACSDSDGRERLTLEGDSATFEAPVPAPVLAATAEVFEPVSPYRRAVWNYQADLAPVSAGDISIELTWDDPTHDYDLFVTDEEGFELARSADENPDTGEAREAVSFGLGHCEQFTVGVTNFAGAPFNDLELVTTVEPASSARTLQCADGDTAANCAGKAAGEAPDAPVDSRTIYYLAGDTGQGSMVHTQAGAEEVPFRSGLTTERPTGATPNSYTAPPVGFNAYQNPFQAYFPSGDFEDPRDINGVASALVWVSSRTMATGGTLFAQLFADGTLVGEEEIDGAAIGERPTPLTVVFDDVDAPDAWDVTFQLSTEPVASSNGTTSDPGNAQFTVWYDSVQFPSRLTLP